jgi:hypothetical protein
MATNVNVLNTVEVDVDDLPPVTATVVGMPPVSASVTSLPDLRITDIGPVGPVTLAGIPDHYTVAISTLPDLNVRIREIPSIRAHIPANFRLGFSVFGVELAALNLCGEAQVITEPFVPNPCEKCGPPRTPTLSGTPGAVAAVLRLKDEG